MEDSVEAELSESAAATPEARRAGWSGGRPQMPAPPRTGIARCGVVAGRWRSDRWLGTISTRDNILSNQALTEDPPEAYGDHW